MNSAQQTNAAETNAAETNEAKIDAITEELQKAYDATKRNGLEVGGLIATEWWTDRAELIEALKAERGW